MPVPPPDRYQFYRKARPDHWCHRRHGQRQIQPHQLIPRFYDATEGTVEILGRPAQEYPRAALRGSVAVVMQKAQLFGGTIRSNLLWGNKKTRRTLICGPHWRLRRLRILSGQSPLGWTSLWSRAAGTCPAARSSA